MAYGQFSRMLAKHIIKCVGLLPRKTSRTPSSYEGQPGSEDGGGLQHTLQVWSDAHWRDCLIYTDQNKRALLTYMAWTSRQIGSGRI